MNTKYRCERAGSQHAEGLLALFESAGTGCFCNYWHFEGDKNAWLERCFIRPEDNRVALLTRLSEPDLCGVVALTSGQDLSPLAPSTREAPAVCGWLKLTRTERLPKLYEQRVYRGLPCFGETEGSREGVYAIGCYYVAESERGQGVARALLSAAIEVAREAGARALEAFPRACPTDGTEPLRADEIWMGPESLFRGAGFAKVSDFRPYPVLRLHLG